MRQALDMKHHLLWFLWTLFLTITVTKSEEFDSVRYVDPSYALTKDLAQGILFMREGQIIMAQSFKVGNPGAAKIYERQNVGADGVWTTQTLQSAHQIIGYSASDGNRLVLSLYWSPSLGGFSVFERNTAGTWVEGQVIELPASAGLVNSIAINDTLVAVGATFGIYVYQLQTNGTWTGPTIVTPSSCLGPCTVKFLSWVGNTVAALYSQNLFNDTVSLFNPSSGWSEQSIGSFPAPGVGLAFDGQHLAYCIESPPSCTLFRFENSSWVSDAIINGDVSQFGQSLGFAGEHLLIGSPNAFRPNSSLDTGAAYLYTYSGSEWVLDMTLYSTIANNSQFFGYSVGIDTQDIAVYAVFSGANTPYLFVTPIVPPALVTEEPRSIAIVAASTSAAAFIALVVVAGALSYKFHVVPKREKRRRLLQDQEISSQYSVATTTLMNQEPPELPGVKFGPLIGKGYFAQVFKGTYNGKTVAIKMQPGSIHEGEKMQGLSHPRIIKVHKVWPVGELSLVIMDYMPLGTLIDYFKANLNSITLPHLVHFTSQIVEGMCALVENHLVHCDLKMGNVLVNSDLNICISDFGLSRVTEYNMQQESVMNVRWSPPEAFLPDYRVDSTFDVWSFGVLVWELFAYPARPYDDLPTHQMTSLPAWLQQGNRLAPPDTSPQEFSALMLDCWNAQRTKRPTFPEIAARIANMECVASETESVGASS